MSIEKLFITQIVEVRKNLNKLKFHSGIDSIDYENLNNYDFAENDKYRKIESIRTLFRELDTLLIHFLIQF